MNTLDLKVWFYWLFLCKYDKIEVGNESWVDLLFRIQDVCLVFSLIIVFLSFFSTYIFQVRYILQVKYISWPFILTEKVKLSYWSLIFGAKIQNSEKSEIRNFGVKIQMTFRFDGKNNFPKWKLTKVTSFAFLRYDLSFWRKN